MSSRLGQSVGIMFEDYLGVSCLTWKLSFLLCQGSIETYPIRFGDRFRERASI